jgi:hypothetical protein
MGIKIGYNQKVILRTGTGNWIRPNTIPVLEPELEYIFIILVLVNPDPEFEILLPVPEIGFHWMSGRNFLEFVFLNIYFIQKVFIKVWYAFYAYFLTFGKYSSNLGYIRLRFWYVPKLWYNISETWILISFPLTGTGIRVLFWFLAR